PDRIIKRRRRECLREPTPERRTNGGHAVAIQVFPQYGLWRSVLSGVIPFVPQLITRQLLDASKRVEDEKPVAEEIAKDRKLRRGAPLQAAGFYNNFPQDAPSLRQLAREQNRFRWEVRVYNIEIDTQELPQEPKCRNARNGKQPPIGQDEVGHPH